MHLAKDVRNYYLEHFTELSLEKQFHFAGRLYLWSYDQEAKQLLESLKARFITDKTTAKQSLQTLTNTQVLHDISGADLRAEYFKKYPLLNGYNLMLFQVRHMRVFYGTDYLPELLEIADKEALLDLAHKLLDDPKALQILSTYAVNYLYLLEYLFEDFKLINANIEHFYQLGMNYDLSDIEELRLCIYLYTHCIIGDSNYYDHTISNSRLTVYTKMLERLEVIISDNFSAVSLDNKLEFLVCARLCNFTTSLDEKVYTECQESISPAGTFLVDAQNDFAETSTKKDFESSEHRSVLFIMSSSNFSKN